MTRRADEPWWVSRGIDLLEKASRAFSKWILPENEGRNGIQHVISVGTGIIFGTAAMVTFLQQTGTTKTELITHLYLPVVIIMIVALALIVLSWVRTDSGWRFLYNGPTRMIGCLAVLVSVVGVYLVTQRGLSGTLPGQEPKRPRSVRFTDATSYVWQDDLRNKKESSGIIATIDIDEKLFPGRMPNRLHFVFDLREPLSLRWKIQQIKLTGQDVKSGKELRPVLFIANENDEDGEANLLHADALFPQNIDPANTYSIRMYLWSPRRYPVDQIEADAALIREGRGVRVSDRSNITSH